MKTTKFYFTLLLLFSTYLSVYSQENGQKIIFCNTPNQEGFQLVKTSTIDGVKCEHYEKNGVKVRTFIKDNGDFITIEEDEYGFDKIPEKNIKPYTLDPTSETPTALSFPSRFSAQSGIICTREKLEGLNNFKYRTTFPDGSYVESSNKISYYPETWKIFKSGEVTIKDYSGDSLHIDKLNKTYPIVDLRETAGYSGRPLYNDLYGVDINNRFCTLHPDGTISRPFMQKFGDRYYFAISSDSIVNVKQYENKVGRPGHWNYEISYANGDSVVIENTNMNTKCYDNDEIYYAKIHRNNGILEIKDKKKKLILPDGSVYDGSDYMGCFKSERVGIAGPNEVAAILGDEIISYNNGKLMLPPDGRIVQYMSGETDEERNKSRQEKEKEEKEIYDKLCAQFGKKNVDAAIAGTPIVGMPEKLFIAVFKPELSQEYSNSRCYHVRGWGVRNGSSRMTLTNKALKYSVWVTNGKVSSISTW